MVPETRSGVRTRRAARGERRSCRRGENGSPPWMILKIRRKSAPHLIAKEFERGHASDLHVEERGFGSIERFQTGVVLAHLQRSRLILLFDATEVHGRLRRLERLGVQFGEFFHRLCVGAGQLAFERVLSVSSLARF